MHAAKLEDSPRLRRVLGVLSDGKEHTTLDIATRARVCAVNSCIAELRENGVKVECRQQYTAGQRLWLYRLKGAGQHAP